MTGNACIHHAEVVEWCRAYDGEPFHAVLCDPPYHLTSITRNDRSVNPENKGQTVSPFGTQAKGFMGKTWDGGDVAFQPETWEAIASICYPGALIFAFAGTRGYHRQAVAMEDSGLTIHPLIAWVQGSGFPKATRIPDEAFAGHRYGLQAMKPAIEPIAVAQVPYRGKPRECIVETGAGAFNVDAGRVAAKQKAWGSGNRDSWRKTEGRTDRQPNRYGEPDANASSRWPSNVILSPEAAALMDSQSGMNHIIRNADVVKNDLEKMRKNVAGGQSRFYHVCDWDAEEADPFLYCAKAGRGERDAGLDAFTAQYVKTLSGGERQPTGQGAARSGAVDARNPHPTVKPLRLTKHLASLLLPPDAYAPRRLLVPFAGTGSEMIGAILAGWESVVGVEMTEEYVDIARARLRFWQGNVGLFEAITAESEDEPEQLGMEL